VTEPDQWHRRLRNFEQCDSPTWFDHASQLFEERAQLNQIAQCEPAGCPVHACIGER
jgi:hypothetical protein